MPSSDKLPAFDGGEGSGNFWHEGRPGELGGSGEGGENNDLDKKEKKKKEELLRIQSYNAPLAKRHAFNSIRKQSQSRTGDNKNTIILPNVNYHKDIEDIKKGLYNKDKDEFIVNGRAYKADNGHFYPSHGEGFVSLNKNEYEAFKLMKLQPDNPKLDFIFKKLNLSDEEIKKVKELVKRGENCGR